jgi:hypothetical protein
VCNIKSTFVKSVTFSSAESILYLYRGLTYSSQHSTLSRFIQSETERPRNSWEMASTLHQETQQANNSYTATEREYSHRGK